MGNGPPEQDQYEGMERSVAHDLATVHQKRGGVGLHSTEAMRTVRSLLAKHYDQIDREIPPVAFVLRRQFRQALGKHRKQLKSESKEQSEEQSAVRRRINSGSSAKNVRSPSRSTPKKKRSPGSSGSRRRGRRRSKQGGGGSPRHGGAAQGRPSGGAVDTESSSSRDEHWRKERLLEFMANDLGL